MRVMTFRIPPEDTPVSAPTGCLGRWVMEPRAWVDLGGLDGIKRWFSRHLTLEVAIVRPDGLIECIGRSLDFRAFSGIEIPAYVMQVSNTGTVRFDTVH